MPVIIREIRTDLEHWNCKFLEQKPGLGRTIDASGLVERITGYITLPEKSIAAEGLNLAPSQAQRCADDCIELMMYYPCTEWRK